MKAVMNSQGRRLTTSAPKVPLNATCTTCRWYEPAQDWNGTCRRYAPVVHQRVNNTTEDSEEMELNLQQVLGDLEDAYRVLLTSPADCRGELATTLHRVVVRAEIEAGNLMREAAADFEKRILYKRLLCTVELAKGSLPQA
jgi:hypothetical protein